MELILAARLQTVQGFREAIKTVVLREAAMHAARLAMLVVFYTLSLGTVTRIIHVLYAAT